MKLIFDFISFSKKELKVGEYDDLNNLVKNLG